MEQGLTNHKVNIKNVDLFTQQFDIDTLVRNIDKLDLKTILRTQKLTVEFCVDYLMNDDYMSCVEDTYYFVANIIIFYQKHITMDDIIDYVKSKDTK